jgi:hypothetical protein
MTECCRTGDEFALVVAQSVPCEVVWLDPVSWPPSSVFVRSEDIQSRALAGILNVYNSSAR